MYVALVVIEGTRGKFVLPVMDEEGEDMALFESSNDIKILHDDHTYRLALGLLITVR